VEEIREAAGWGIVDLEKFFANWRATRQRIE